MVMPNLSANVNPCDTAIYACGRSIDTVIVKLENDLQNILDSFKENGICTDPAKFQMMLLGLIISNPLCRNINELNVKQSEYVHCLASK